MRQQFCRAARHGKHVIVEKPLAIEWSDILAMKKAGGGDRHQDVRLLRVPVFVAVPRHESRCSTPGLVGRLHYGEIDYYHGIGPWYGQYRWNTKRQQGGSALLTAGCHALDALLLCMNDEVEEVTSYATQSANPIFQAYEYPTTSTTILRFKNGSVGSAPRSSIACSRITSTRTWSAAKAASSTTSSTRRSSPA